MIEKWTLRDWLWKIDVCFSGIQPEWCGLDGRVETPGNISNPEVKHSNGEDSVKAKIARGHAKRAGLVSRDTDAFL